MICKLADLLGVTTLLEHDLFAVLRGFVHKHSEICLFCIFWQLRHFRFFYRFNYHAQVSNFFLRGTLVKNYNANTREFINVITGLQK